MASRVPPLLAAGLISGVAVLYLWVVLDEPDPNDMGVVVAFAGGLFIAAAAAVAGTLVRDSFTRRTAFGAACLLTFALAWLSGFSIGPLLLPSVLLLAYAVGRG
jgi:MFS family permease